MRLRFLEAAELELEVAIAWYREKGEAIADRFIAEIRDARVAILDQPHAWHPLGEGVRRYRLRRFPYGLIYVVDGDDLLVLAVAHHSRRPAYWRDRLRAQ